jgi:hypothetical protein
MSFGQTPQNADGGYQNARINEKIVAGTVSTKALHVASLAGQGSTLVAVDNEGKLFNSSGLSEVATIRLTSAQLLAIGTTPVEFIPAPGPGYFIQAIGNLSATLIYGTTTYTGSHNLVAQYGDTADAGGTALGSVTSALVLDTVSAVAVAATTLSTTALTAVDGYGIYLTSSANYAAGDGEVIVTLPYIIVPVAAI